MTSRSANGFQRESFQRRTKKTTLIKPNGGGHWNNQEEDEESTVDHQRNQSIINQSKTTTTTTTTTSVRKGMENSSSNTLHEPLLPTRENHNKDDDLCRGGQNDDASSLLLFVTGTTTTSSIASPLHDETNNSNNDDTVNHPPPLSSAGEPPSAPELPAAFTVAAELAEMAHLAWPLAVSFFCRMGMASTDSAFVGHIHDHQRSPETYLAAAVLSDLVVNCLITPPLAFNQVLNALVAQAIGSGHPKSAGLWLQQSLFWLSVSMLPFLVGFFHVERILLWLGFHPDVAVLAGTYAKYNLLWPIPNGWYQCMRFYFQAQGLPRPAMYNNLLFLVVNVLLNYWFIFILQWGFIGAAISLSCSRSLQPIVYYYYMFVWKQHHRATWPDGPLSWSYHTKARTMEFLQQALPNVGTLLVQQVANQATTVLVGKLGTSAMAVSSALGIVTTPWAGTVSATSWTVTSVRVGYHLGRGDAYAAQQAASYVLGCITIATAVAGIVGWYGRRAVLAIATDDQPLIDAAADMIPALVVGTYLSLIVGNITSGVFSGLGRPALATILSFCFELPLSILGVAVYILHFHGDLLGVYWLQAALSFVECIVVGVILTTVDWHQCAQEVQRRQQDSSSSSAASPTTTVLAPTPTTMALEEGGVANEDDDDDNDELLVPLICNAAAAAPNHTTTVTAGVIAGTASAAAGATKTTTTTTTTTTATTDEDNDPENPR